MRFGIALHIARPDQDTGCERRSEKYVGERERKRERGKGEEKKRKREVGKEAS